MTNVLWCLPRVAAGEPSITPAIVDRLWDERRGLFLDEVQPGGARPDVSTWAALSPLALPDLPEEIGRRLVEEHLLDPRRYWLTNPPPSVSAAEPTFEPNRGTGLEAALLARADLGQRGMDAVAGHAPARLRRRGGADGRAPDRRSCCATACASTTTRNTGEGLGAREFAWTSLIMEMAEPDPGWA